MMAWPSEGRIGRKEFVKKGHCLAIGLALLSFLTLWDLVSAAELPEDDPDQDTGRRVGLVSTEVKCLAVRAGAPDATSATVRLEWKGEIEEAFLVLAAAGSEGGHSIYVNGRRVGGAPVRPDGPLCHAGSRVPMWGATDIIPIPVEVLTNGENVITLANDANVDDGWTAANLHIEIHGVLSGPPVAALEATPLVKSGLNLDGTTPISGSILLTSTYELAQGRPISQLVSYQVPVGYTGNISMPLIVGAHGMGQTGEQMRDYLAGEANDRGWLLAAPEMHGHYYTNFGRYALGYVGAQHDIIDTIDYMMSEYEIDPSRIYITGGSMGGQITAIMAVKYPDTFAAAAEWKGITDLADWYNNELVGDSNQSRLRDETGGTPEEVPFEYQRRSAMAMPPNGRLIPLRIWHDVGDSLVQIYHSYDLRDAVNSWGPPIPVTVIAVDTGLGHDYRPELADVLDFLTGFTPSSQSPTSVTIRTDESKPYYWLNFAQTGGDHWSEVQASYDLTNTTVTAAISDTRPLTLAFNLGSMPIVGRVMERSGIGLPATTYLIKGGGNYRLQEYASGYLTTTLAATGQFTLTISAVAAKVSADPAMVLGGETTTSTIVATLEDHLGNPIPDGTVVRFDTSEGTFPNASATYTAATTGGMVTGTLTLPPAADLAEIVVSFGSVTTSASVDVIHPALELLVAPSQTTVDSGQAVTYAYRITNTGDITLTAVTVADDNGTPGDSGDDVQVWADISLVAGEKKNKARRVTLTQTTTNTVVVTGRHPLGQETARYSTTVVVRPPYVKVYLPVVKRDQSCPTTDFNKSFTCH
jgi:pimeloyl-ACP methyl ester carboxylesterase